MPRCDLDLLFHIYINSDGIGSVAVTLQIVDLALKVRPLPDPLLLILER